MNNLTQLSGKLYPDKSFTIGIVPRKKARSQDKQYERAYRAQPETDYGALADWYEGTNSVEGKYQSISERPLFIESPKSSRKPRGSYGKHGITTFGRRMVKNGALLLEEKYGRARLGFVTCTIPAFPASVHRRINGVWSEITRRFYQKVKRQLEKVSKPFIYVGVTEIQERRFKTSGIPCPHLHFVYLCRDNSRSMHWVYICQLHRAWNESIREGIALAGYPLSMSGDIPWGSVQASCVRKSAAAYLGKYMSKGAKVLKDMQEAGWTEFPKQWWNASMQTKKMVMSAIITLTQDECKALFYGFEHYLQEGIITWGRFVDVCIGGEYRTMGLIGVLLSDAYICFRDG